MVSTFRLAAGKAGLGWATPHTLRHTCASMLAQKGVDVDTIADYLAADRQTIWRVYRRQHPDYLKSAADALDDSPVMEVVETPHPGELRH